MGDWKKNLNRSNRRKSASAEQPRNPPQTQTLLSRDLNENLQVMQNIYADCSDVIFHDFLIGEKTKSVLIYIDGLSHVEEVDQHVLAALQRDFALEHTLQNIRKKLPSRP